MSFGVGAQRAVRAVAATVLITLGMGGCSRGAPIELVHDVYVWQLAWTPSVRTALARTAPSVERVHVLALEVDPLGDVRRASIDADALRALGQRLVAVIRIDGRSEDLPLALDDVRNVLQAWRSQGLEAQAVEIDFDCGTLRLEAYAQFLRAVREVLAPDMQLYITALPAWLSSPHLATVARLADEVVLQVHSVRNPMQGLFTANEAYEWLRAYARVSPRPFKVALPTYGSRVGWHDDGRIASIDSEMRPRMAGVFSRELAVDPEVMVEFLRRLSREPVPGLSGVVWFRMPTDADRRAWSVTTFLAVIRGTPLRQTISATLERRGAASTRDVVVVNTGNVDAPAPLQIRIEGQCRNADAVSGYILQRDAGSVRWVRASARAIRAGAAINVGWADCMNAEQPLEIVN